MKKFKEVRKKIKRKETVAEQGRKKKEKNMLLNVLFIPTIMMSEKKFKSSEKNK